MPTSKPTPTPKPIPTLSPKEERKPVKVKGVYVTGPKTGSSGMDDLISLVDETKPMRWSLILKMILERLHIT